VEQVVTVPQLQLLARVQPTLVVAAAVLNHQQLLKVQEVLAVAVQAEVVTILVMREQ
jgi:hypothetical protein